MYNFNDKVVWITGASSGIGENMAYLFSKLGAKIILSARNEEKLNIIAGNCNNSKDHLVLKLDLENNQNLDPITSQVIERYGKIDMVVNCGGVSQHAISYETLQEIERKIIEVNFWGTVNLTKAILPYMFKNNSGRIIVISSVHGKVGLSTKSSYSASKHALLGYFDSLRADLIRNGHNGIKVMVVCPGYIKTNISINYFGGTGKNLGKMDKNHEDAMSPAKCAEKIVKAIYKNKNEVLVGGKETLAVHLKRFFPSFFLKNSHKFYP